MSISTHVLDSVTGQPAAGIAVRLVAGADVLAEGVTDHDGRCRLVEGNRAYEERFGHVFLIRAAGRTPEQMLAELRRRLGNDADAERAEATEQLAQITGLRVRGLLS